MLLNKMASSILLSIPVVLPLLPTAYGWSGGISAREAWEEMEHLLVDNGGTNSDAFVDAVTPCSNYVGFQSNGDNRGEQSSAQWVRIVFHDFVTADVSAGTGGLDASIGFESDRDENPGFFVNDTLQFMLPTATAYLSMADNIALGLVAAVSQCQGSVPDIDLRIGRIDATEAGPSGVPEPTTDLETTFAQFAAAGFDQSDAIAVTACGHSLGRIHYSNFPDIVSEDFVTSTNLDGGEGFDSTPADFDNAVVLEYLNGTGLMGGPLVTAPDEADRSDLRLYTSDNNATIEALADEVAFRDTCFDLFERMINTVPSTVTLSDPVTPMTWKAVNLALDINSSGTVTAGGMFRYFYSSGSAPSSVSYSFTATTSSDATTTTGTASTASGTGTSMFGNTKYWSFNTTIDSPGTTNLTIEDTTDYDINDSLFILPKKSSVASKGNTMTLRAAALTSLVSDDTDMTGILYVPTSQQGTVLRSIENVTVSMAAYDTAGDYTLFQGTSGTLDRVADVVAKVILGDQGSATLKTKLFINGQ